MHTVSSVCLHSESFKSQDQRGGEVSPGCRAPLCVISAPIFTLKAVHRQEGDYIWLLIVLLWKHFLTRSLTLQVPSWWVDSSIFCFLSLQH